MKDMPSVDRAELDADREQLASLPDDEACALPVGRVRRYLEALAVALPARGEPPGSPETMANWDTLFRKSDAPTIAGIELRPSSRAPAVPLAPAQRLQPWTFHRLARPPSRGTIALIAIGVAVVLITSAFRLDVPQRVGEAVIFTLVGVRAMGITVRRDMRKRGPQEVHEDACDEPRAVVACLLIFVTCAAATVVVYEGGRLAGIGVSVIGAGLVGLLVTLSLALDYGVVSAERLSLMK